MRHIQLTETHGRRLVLPAEYLGVSSPLNDPENSTYVFTIFNPDRGYFVKETYQQVLYSLESLKDI
jgi:hypothetical protein